MNKTCRGCNNELDNCTCNVLTTDRPESLEAKVLRDEIKNLRLINESHQKLNGELRERIKELESLIPTKEEAKKLIVLLTEVYVENYDKAFRETAQSGFAKLQKIIDKRG